MKTRYLILALSLFMAACHHKEQQPEQKPKTQIPSRTVSPAEVQKIQQHFAPFMNGVWVATTYIQSIKQTRSPYKSQEELDGICEISIDMSTVQGDSVAVGVSLGNHEGGSFFLYLHQGQKQDRLPISDPYSGGEAMGESPDYELGYSVQRGDTSLFMYVYDRQHHSVDSICYSRVLEKNADPSSGGNGIQYIVNHLLIAGDYALRMPDGSIHSIHFADDGTVSGLPEFKTYYVLTDFAAEPHEFDQISFDIQTSNQRHYILKICQEALCIYEAITDEEDASILQRGKLVYNLMHSR